ncbi:MAG: endolytic transglycosylase MltG [Candidatus Nomurabacteria bacterium]|jgi:UPF0755 protein|nr:endolytic transglycosylase MltG [Candidatus Nomurabacteria bacterium]
MPESPKTPKIPKISISKTPKTTKIPKAPKPEKYVRRPSVEIAKEFVELNLKAVIDAEKLPNLTKKERRAMRKREKQEKRRRFRKIKIFFSIVILLCAAAGIANFWWNTSIQAVDEENRSVHQFDVDRGATTDDVAEGLYKAGFIRSALAFKIYARWTGNMIQAGSHMLSPSYTMIEISDKLTEASTQEVSVQIPPGLTLKQLRETFKRNGFTDEEIDRAYKADYDSAILEGRPEGATLEGYIFPETYRIYAGDSLETLIKKSLDEFEKVVNENDLRQKFADKGLTLYEGITLSSIVELEVTNADDQKTVAGVFYNRIASGIVLGSDVTYVYAFSNGLCGADTVASPKCQSVYNTRINAGLPPSPIANVNLQALLSTVEPANSEYYYFVAGEDGKTYFSKTEAEHNANVSAHCGSLCR